MAPSASSLIETPNQSAMADSHLRRSVHQALGAGSVADVLLWKNYCGGFAILTWATALWFLFERAGYNSLSFASNVLLLLVFVLFFWAKAASLLNRPLPPVPDLEISEASATKAAEELQTWINYALLIGYEIATGRNLILFFEVAAALWFLSYLGNMFNLLTLIYIGVLLSLSVPLLYEKYQDKLDDKLSLVFEIIQIQKKIFNTAAIRSYKKQRKMQ